MRLALQTNAAATKGVEIRTANMAVVIVAALAVIATVENTAAKPPAIIPTVFFVVVTVLADFRIQATGPA